MRIVCDMDYVCHCGRDGSATCKITILSEKSDVMELSRIKLKRVRCRVRASDK
jgi:hypothetical protein